MSDSNGLATSSKKPFSCKAASASSYTILATPRLSRARRFRRRKSASSPKARPNREEEPKAFLALLRMVSPAVTPMVASPSVRKITRGTRRDESGLVEAEDGGLTSWAAASRAALILVPVTEEWINPF